MPAACAVERNRWSPLVSQASLDGTREALSSQSESFTFAKIIHPLMKRINVRHQQAPASARQLRNFVRWCVLAALLLAGWSVGHPSARAASPDQIAARAPVAELNNKNGLAVKGYDVVAYFSDGRPVKGTANESYQWQGATWQFASPEHRAAFMREAARYAPQYGGYCAYAVAQGDIVDIDPKQWKIVDGKLYLNANFLAQTLWLRDPAGHIKNGDANWRIIPRRPL
jgi:YHS domain-containing protein